MSVLEHILAYKREEVTARKAARSWAEVEQTARVQGAARGFVAALAAKAGHVFGRPLDESSVRQVK